MALNCVANSRLAEQGPFERFWVQPAAGDAGAALGAALAVARQLGDATLAMSAVALGGEWTDDELERRCAIPGAINTSLIIAGRPMVDDPCDALECFGSSTPFDVLVLGPFILRPRLPAR